MESIKELNKLLLGKAKKKINESKLGVSLKIEEIGDGSNAAYNNKVFFGNGKTVSVAADTSYRHVDVSDWAIDASKWGLEIEIIDGNSHPHGTTTEEILVHMLQRCASNGVFN